MVKFSFVSALLLALVPSAIAQDAGGAAGGGVIGQLLFFVPLILIFYFLLIRPANQRQKKHREMVEALKKGDTVIMSGGVIGKVTRLEETELTLEVSDGVRVRVMRGMVADVKNAGTTAAND